MDNKELLPELNKVGRDGKKFIKTDGLMVKRYLIIIFKMQLIKLILQHIMEGGLILNEESLCLQSELDC